MCETAELEQRGCTILPTSLSDRLKDVECHELAVIQEVPAG